MILTTLYTLLWLLVTFTFSECLILKVSRSITAEYGKPVTLHCNVSSSLNGLSIKHMEWSQSRTYCSVNSVGNITQCSSLGDFQCDYEQAHLSIHFKKWHPQQSESAFMCKLRSNQGILSDYTEVETRECWGDVEAVWRESPTCTFRKVWPDGEVDWFHDNQRITGQSLVSTYKQVDADGWMTISSYLNKQSTNVRYNCTLKSVRSGQYLASSLVHSASYVRGRATAQGSSWAYLWISVMLVIEKHTHLNQ